MTSLGFENPGGSLTGGIQATGNYPGKARNATELRADLEQALSLIPGAKTPEPARHLPRDPTARWRVTRSNRNTSRTGWSGRKANKLGLDFNPSCFSHPLSADGFTLSHANDEIRQFWIDHVQSQPPRLGLVWRTARHAVSDEHLDPGRHERYHRRPPGAAPASAGRAG